MPGFFRKLVMWVLIQALVVGQGRDVSAQEKPSLRDTVGEPALSSPRRSSTLDFRATERIQTLLDILRTYEVRDDQQEWASALRELIDIGKPAVPLLCEELDRAERNQTLRALGFILRGCNDPRAIPALIRAIPRTLQPSCSDYGLSIKNDEKLLKFLQDHDNSRDSRDEYFSYGRPFREILPALNELTGVKHWELDINFVHLGGGARQRRLQHDLYQRLAEQWADWWAENWRKYLTDERDAQLEFTRQFLADARARYTAVPLPPIPETLPSGPDITAGNASSEYQMEALAQCRDLDTGRAIKPPKLLAMTNRDGKSSQLFIDWAASQGVDLYGIKMKLPGSNREFYVLQPVGMRVWRVDNPEFGLLVEKLRDGLAPDLGDPVQGPLAQRDAAGNYTPDEPATFVFITREGSCGALQIGAQVERVLVRGAAIPPERPLSYKFFYENVEDVND